MEDNKNIDEKKLKKKEADKKYNELHKEKIKEKKKIYYEKHKEEIKEQRKQKQMNINKYDEGKIYKITCNNTNKFYIGSTIQTLQQRLTEHKKKYNLYLKKKYTYNSSFEIIKNNNYKIELIEFYKCNNKKELQLKEGEYIRNYFFDVNNVNIQVEGRTHKEWRQDNKEKLNEYMKNYKEENKDNYKKYNQTYKNKNKEQIKEANKKYREDNKDKLKEKYINYDKLIRRYKLKPTRSIKNIYIKKYFENRNKLKIDYIEKYNIKNKYNKNKEELEKYHFNKYNNVIYDFIIILNQY